MDTLGHVAELFGHFAVIQQRRSRCSRIRGRLRRRSLEVFLLPLLLLLDDSVQEGCEFRQGRGYGPHHCLVNDR